MIDEKVGEIMTALEESGRLDNSVVIFTSDHGDCLTDHGHSQKWTMYEQITRIPMIVWSPGRYDAGRVVDGLCQQMDIGPTLLEIADVRIPDTMEAQSLAAPLAGDDWKPREYVYAEHGRDGILDSTDFMTMVRDERWKLVHFVDEDEGQLFDLETDPNEMVNLWRDPDAVAEKDRLLKEMLEWRVRSLVHTAPWASNFR
jgi:arylsulfatase A-like enzyme